MSEENERKVSIVNLSEGQTLFKQGQQPQGIYFIKEGVLEASVEDPISGKERKVGNLKKGELVGEMSYLDGQPRCASIKAISKVVLIEIPNENFNQTLEGQPAWLQVLIKTLATRLRSTNAKVFKV